MECGYWLLFDSQMLLIEEKRFPEVTGGGRYFYQKFRKGEGVNVILWKWKIWRDGKVTIIEIPFVVGVWIFSGNTHWFLTFCYWSTQFIVIGVFVVQFRGNCACDFKSSLCYGSANLKSLTWLLPNCNPLTPITILLIVVAVVNVMLIFLTSRFCCKTR